MCKGLFFPPAEDVRFNWFDLPFLRYCSVGKALLF